MGMKIELGLIDPNAFTKAVEVTIFEAVYRTMVNAVVAAKQNTYSEQAYRDRTNNLRSSIGFVIFKDGQIVSSYFNKSGSGNEGDGGKGASRGLESAEEESGQVSSNGYVCVLVAGMHYASSVETKGYDVISGSWSQFDKMFTQEFEALKDIGLQIKISGNKNVSFDEWLAGLDPNDL